MANLDVTVKISDLGAWKEFLAQLEKIAMKATPSTRHQIQEAVEKLKGQNETARQRA